ncbi:PREDICTED: OTU domain-containing protein At3g57810 isoform X2 [Prunus mume]|uniref:Ubiquitin thioesterase OTU n=1 Tax=Prunus mume TaxID=102107 RepID=A0ABM0PK98_PRUMU|nr:PREDICTED: OTU domain-containing protein At3g57810 isoform X2 [Prunus mume]
MKVNLDYQGFVDTIVCLPINHSPKNVVCLSGSTQIQMGSKICSVVSRGASSSCCKGLQTGKTGTKIFSLPLSKIRPTNIGQTSHGNCFRFFFSKDSRSLTVNAGGPNKGSLEISLACRGPAHAEAAYREDEEDDNDLSYVKFSRGKKVYTDYSIIGIPGDGRCLFRSVAHGAYLRAGKAAPAESLQRELADDLRARVADEFIKRREETEWFVEGDFDTYVSQIRRPHVWGGEPELFMASHVLKMPITVYMYDEKAGGLITIAEYGQEYGKENPIKVLYHGFGHYDALRIPGKNGGRSRL